MNDPQQADHEVGETARTASSEQDCIPIQPTVNSTLENINRNMAQMADLLGQFCSRTPTGKPHNERPPGTKRDLSPLRSAFSDSDSDESAASDEGRIPRSHKRRKEDDQISVHADGSDLGYDDDIRMLTEQDKNPSMGNERETASTSTESGMLTELANAFEDEDATTKAVNQQLADIAVKRWGKKLNWQD